MWALEGSTKQTDDDGPSSRLVYAFRFMGRKLIMRFVVSVVVDEWAHGGGKWGWKWSKLEFVAIFRIWIMGS